MAYQNVGTPRFYVCGLQWVKSLGLLNITLSDDSGFINIQNPLDMIGINPSSTVNFSSGHDAVDFHLNFTKFPLFSEKSWLGTFGHSFRDVDTLPHPRGIRITGGGLTFGYGDAAFDSAVNLSATGYSDGEEEVGMLRADYDGFSMATMPTLWSGIDTLNIKFFYSIGRYCNTLAMGSYYDMPHSPDLSLTMTREYGGTKTIETKGGASLSNTFYTKPPSWGDLPAWELSGTYTQPWELSRSGRRMWDLSFSYLDDGDVWGSNQSLGVKQTAEDVWTYYVPFETSGADSGDILYNDDSYAIGYNYNILDDYNFYSQVIHKTNGGQLPFIFQPDNSDNSPQSFALCKFDMKSFQFQQQAPGLYRVSLKIREVW